MEVLTHSANMWFSTALLIMFLFALIEVLSMAIGFGLNDVVDNLLPDFDVPDAPEDIGPVTGLLSWFRLGEVPAFILFVLFLFAFGSVGLVIQLASNSLLGFYMPTVIAVPMAVVVSSPFVRFLGGIAGKFVGKEHTDAISRTGFVGQIATITIGEARKGYAAEAKFRDEHGTTHYVMVESANEDDVFSQGQTVLITGPEDADASVFLVIGFERPVI